MQHPLSFISALAAVATVTANVTCASLSSVALKVSWPLVDASDLYWVAAFETLEAASIAKPRPLALVTTPNATVVLDDLAPSTNYYLRVRSHPEASPSTVWGWRDYLPGVVTCRTAAPRFYSVEREGGLFEDRFGIRWVPHRGSIGASQIVIRVGQVREGHFLAEALSAQHSLAGVVNPYRTVQTVAASSDNETALLKGLEAASTYVVWLETSAGQLLADPVRFRTAAVGVHYERVYRVSEGTDEVDLLLNHNAGDELGEAAFLTDSGNFVLSKSQIAADPCAQVLAKYSGCKPHTDGCMQCAARAWANSSQTAIRAHCSNPAQPFPIDNKAAEDWCGNGFTFFDWKVSPVAEYCVARIPSPTSADSPPDVTPPTYADYLSCDAPEAGSLNSHADPICICPCYADRLIAMQPKPLVEAHCGIEHNHTAPHYKDCHCGANSSSVLVAANDSSLRYVGAMPVFCPYFYWPYPVADYGHRTPCGRWISFPKAGACPPGKRPSSSSTSGESVANSNSSLRTCTWQR
eukprot:SAG31_NODE_641_length_13313_cov_5.365219_2_plen_522_part_00